MKLMADDPAMMLRSGPGTVVSWVRWLVASACIITVLALWIGGKLLVRELAWVDEDSQGQFWLRNGVAYLAIFAIALAIIPSSRLSRFIHAAIALPILHAGLVVVGWLVWKHQLPMLSNMSDGRALAAWFPFATVALIAIPATAIVAGVIARRRAGEWPHAFAMLSLSMLLLVGLWMPIALSIFASGDAWVTDPTSEHWRLPYDPILLAHPVRMSLAILIPPVLVATTYTALAMRRPGWLRAHRTHVVVAVSILLSAALIARMNAQARPMVLYSNFVSFLLVGVLVAVAALLVLALSMLVRGYRLRHRFASRERIVGVVHADGGEPVFGVELPSWLRGPRLLQRPFAIATAAGTAALEHDTSRSRREHRPDPSW
jgi:hypothetical protein